MAGGSQTQPKMAMFAIKSTRVFMYPCTLELSLFSFCNSEFRLTLYFATAYTSVLCKLCCRGRILWHCSTYSSYTINSLLYIACVFHDLEFRAQISYFRYAV